MCKKSDDRRFFKSEKGQSTRTRYMKSEKYISYIKSDVSKKNSAKRTRKYMKSEKGKEYYRQYRKTQKYKEYRRRKTKRRRISHPEQVRARKAIKIAIAAKKIQRPSGYKCRFCFSIAEHFHHHLGYEKEHRLDVQPVCVKCHLAIHSKSTSFI
jgi:hypothetical protein